MLKKATGGRDFNINLVILGHLGLGYKHWILLQISLLKIALKSKPGPVDPWKPHMRTDQEKLKQPAAL